MRMFLSNKRFVSANLGIALHACPAPALVDTPRVNGLQSLVRPSWTTALLFCFGLIWSVIASAQTPVNHAPELQWKAGGSGAPYLTDQTQTLGLLLISGDAANSIGFNVRDDASQNAMIDLTVQHNFGGAGSVVSFGVPGDEGWVRLNSNGFTASAPLSAINQIMSSLSLDIKKAPSNGIRFQITISINDNGSAGACSATIMTPCNKLGTATINVAAGPRSGPQIIDFGANPGPLTFRAGGTFSVAATGGFSGNSVMFSVPATASVCSVAGSTVTMLGIGVCIVAGNQAGSANFTAAPQATQSINIVAPLCRLDVDGDTTYKPLIDGQLLIRHLLGISGPPLVAALPAFPQTATRKTDSEITNYLNTLNLDIDGSGGVPLAATDGMIVLRAMLGFRGAAVTAGLPIPVGASRRDWTTIGPYLSGTCLMPVAP